jgi:hypothetical protein
MSASALVAVRPSNQVPKCAAEQSGATSRITLRVLPPRLAATAMRAMRSDTASSRFKMA